MAKILDFLEKPQFKKVRNEVNIFTDDILHDYLAKLEKIDKHGLINNFFSEKDIYDAVWGTIKLEFLEVIIIDSPLIQRLRHIKHLGLAGLLFPGADYSRFEHTVGTMHIAGKFVERIQTNHKENNFEIEPVKLCRLAAIFHDTGHLFFSHCAEKFYESIFFSRYDEIKNMIKDFEDFKGTKIGFAEMLSVMIIASPAVESLIFKAWELGSAKSLSKIPRKNFINNILALVLGLPTCLVYLPYHSIISGTIDADKCDYLARDSHKTGVPATVDLMRLIQKIKALETYGSLTDIGNAWEEVTGSDTKYFYMGVEPSAVNAIEEIIISRSLMHEKIYFHHKIRTAEEMFRQAVRLLDESGLELFSNITYALKITDNDLVSEHPDAFIRALCNKYNINTEYDFSNEKFLTACGLFKSIYNRQLFKRACVIIYNEDRDIFSTIQSIEIPGAKKTIKNLFDEIFEIKENYFHFINEITTEIRRIFTLLDKEHYRNLPLSIMIVSRKITPNQDFNIWINYGSKKIKYNEIFQGESWLNNRLINYPYHYIVGPPEIRQEIYLAVQKVLFKNYNFLLRESSFIFAKMNENHIEDLRKTLYEKNYYSDAVQLVPGNLLLSSNTEMTLERLEGIGRNFIQYCGPHNTVIKSIEPIACFIKQFIPFLDNKEPAERKEFIEGIARVLENIKITGRNEFVESLCMSFGKIAESENCRVNNMKYFMIGSAGDNSNHIAYYFTEINAYLHTRKMTTSHKQNIPHPGLITQLDTTGKILCPVVFFDDTCYSGKQVMNIFQEMAGIPLKDRCCHEAHGVELNSKQLKKLKASKIFLVFRYLKKGTEIEIKKELHKLGFRNVNILPGNYFPQPLFGRDDIFENELQKNLCRNILSEVGCQLLLAKKQTAGGFEPDWDRERILDSALGYNNAQQLIVLPWNTPTYTLTCFWMKEKVTVNRNTFEWKPLFPRLSK